MIDRRTFLTGLAGALASGTAVAGVTDWFNGARIGAPLPEHDGVFVQGGWQSNARLTLVDFWATWCAPCIVAIPSLNELQQRLGADGVQVIGFSDESVDIVAPFAARKDMRYAVVAGGERPLRGAMKIRALPYALLVDARRRIVWRGQPEDLDEATVRDLIPAASVPA